MTWMLDRPVRGQRYGKASAVVFEGAMPRDRYSTIAGMRLIAALSSLLAIAAMATGCGSSKASTASSAVQSHVKLDAAGELEPPREAPEIALRNWNGQPVRLSQYRGRAVMLTFIYDHCPDTCPLIVEKLGQSLELLGSRASQMQVIAVSVDPVGDTPKTVKAFLVKHRMLGRMDYLIGSRSELAKVWKDYGIGVEASPEQREVSHTALIYGVTGKGAQLALYDQQFEPSEIVHDVPLLAGA